MAVYTYPMEDLRQLALDILGQGYLMSLATSDKNGLWVSDVVYVHDDDFSVYWVSVPQVRHSQALTQKKDAAASITVSNSPGEKNIGLQISGIAAKTTPSNEVVQRYADKRHYKTTTLRPGHEWYCLKPIFIDIIYEPNWGYEKKTIKF